MFVFLKGFGVINIFEEGIVYGKTSKDQRAAYSLTTFPLVLFL